MPDAIVPLATALLGVVVVVALCVCCYAICRNADAAQDAEPHPRQGRGTAIGGMAEVQQPTVGPLLASDRQPVTAGPRNIGMDPAAQARARPARRRDRPHRRYRHRWVRRRRLAVGTRALGSFKA
jgi:hypothetical protein